MYTKEPSVGYWSNSNPWSFMILGMKSWASHPRPSSTRQILCLPKPSSPTIWCNMYSIYGSQTSKLKLRLWVSQTDRNIPTKIPINKTSHKKSHKLTPKTHLVRKILPQEASPIIYRKTEASEIATTWSSAHAKPKRLRTPSSAQRTFLRHSSVQQVLLLNILIDRGQKEYDGNYTQQHAGAWE